MSRRAAFLILALLAWVAGSAVGAGGPVRPATATAVLQIGRAHEARHVPALDGATPIFILALGSDARPGEEIDRARADSIHLIAINPARKAGTIVGFPRDAWVEMPGRGSARINAAMFYGGPELMVQTVESITGIRIDYYVLTSFQGLKSMIDAVGGLVIDVPYAMSDAASGANFEAGRQRLTGAETLAFSRNRHDPPDGDFGRSENQGRVLLAALAQFRKQFTRDPSVLLTWVGAGLRNVTTDLPLEEVLLLAFTASQVNPEAVANVVVPGGVGMVGGASVVFLSSQAGALFADVAADGILDRPVQATPTP